MSHRYYRLRNGALHTCLVLLLVLCAPSASSTALPAHSSPAQPPSKSR
jgi:hypothetical protein